MTSKPNSLELQVYRSPLDTISFNGLSPPSPNTPTICLSAPKSSLDTSGFNFPSITNQGFVDDELSLDYGLHGNYVHGWDVPGVLDTASMSSMLSLPTAAVAGAIALSPGTRSLQTVPQCPTPNTSLTCDSPTLQQPNGSNSSLTIPNFNSGLSLNKRHSFPLPDDPTPALLSPKYSLKHQKSLDGLNCISNSFDSSPISPLSPMNHAWARKLSNISSSNNSIISSDGSFSIDGDDLIKAERFRQIFKTVASKANKIRQNKIHPEALQVPLSKKRKRLDSFAPSSNVEETALEVSFFSKKIIVPKWLKRLKYMKSIDPAGSFWLSWLFVVAMAFVYNAFTIFLRGVFGYDNGFVDEGRSFWLWLIIDIVFDLVYLLDIFFRMRIQYIDGGLYVEDKELTRKHYFSTRNFKWDVISLLPFDLLVKIWFDKRYLIFIRLPRLFKYHCYSEFVSRFESSSSFANAFRVGKMVSYLLYMIHLNTCCYYAISLYEGLGFNDWVYNEAENSNPYIRCMYRATKTLITIGNLPVPKTDLEIVFMNVDFAIGIFVFASIIGQMRDIVGAASATKERFRERMDNTMLLMKNWKIPEHVQRKVRMWYMYKWDNGELIDEADILSGVPLKMQTDIAIHVHMDTLTKVSLFQDCDKMLLRDLMLKLRAVLFLPGDFICRKGEVGKEMYIIKSGQVQVIGGGKVLATLHPGSVFGEISLLSLSGGNRRTADVYSPGYSNLFVLDKKTLQETLVNYPEAQELLQKKANDILRKNEENGVGPKRKRRGKSLIVESILTSDKTSTPRFFNAVLHVSRDRKLAATILKGSMSQDISDDDNDDDDMFVDGGIQDHRNSVTAEPNVMVHHPPADAGDSEELRTNTDQCNVRCGFSLSPDDLPHTIVVKEVCNNQPIKLEQPITKDCQIDSPNKQDRENDANIVRKDFEKSDSSSKQCVVSTECDKTFLDPKKSLENEGNRSSNCADSGIKLASASPKTEYSSTQPSFHDKNGIENTSIKNSNYTLKRQDSYCSQNHQDNDDTETSDNKKIRGFFQPEHDLGVNQDNQFSELNLIKNKQSLGSIQNKDRQESKQSKEDSGFSQSKELDSETSHGKEDSGSSQEKQDVDFSQNINSEFNQKDSESGQSKHIELSQSKKSQGASQNKDTGSSQKKDLGSNQNKDLGYRQEKEDAVSIQIRQHSGSSRTMQDPDASQSKNAGFIQNKQNPETSQSKLDPGFNQSKQDLGSSQSTQDPSIESKEDQNSGEYDQSKDLASIKEKNTAYSNTVSPRLKQLGKASTYIDIEDGETFLENVNKDNKKS